MSDDDSPQLSAETFAALLEFYREQEYKDCGHETDHSFQENWQLSQFWYNDDTINSLVHIISSSLKIGDRVALISCPSLYKPLKSKVDISCEVHLYEFDSRFAIFGHDFIKYDYNFPLSIRQTYQHYYDVVIADPPFLSEECLRKTALTIKYICKEKIILCTGAVMSSLANQLLSLKKSNFEPHHKNNLANEFCCLSNYNIDELLTK